MNGISGRLKGNSCDKWKVRGHGNLKSLNSMEVFSWDDHPEMRESPLPCLRLFDCQGFWSFELAGWGSLAWHRHSPGRHVSTWEANLVEKSSYPKNYQWETSKEMPMVNACNHGSEELWFMVRNHVVNLPTVGNTLFWIYELFKIFKVWSWWPKIWVCPKKSGAV